MKWKVVLIGFFVVAALVAVIKESAPNIPPPPSVPVTSTPVDTPPAAPTIAPQPPAVIPSQRAPMPPASSADAQISPPLVVTHSNNAILASNILADLRSPDPKVREAAIEAARQFDSSNGMAAPQ